MHCRGASAAAAETQPDGGPQQRLERPRQLDGNCEKLLGITGSVELATTLRRPRSAFRAPSLLDEIMHLGEKTGQIGHGTAANHRSDGSLVTACRSAHDGAAWQRCRTDPGGCSALG